MEVEITSPSTLKPLINEDPSRLEEGAPEHDSPTKLKRDYAAQTKQPDLAAFVNRADKGVVLLDEFKDIRKVDVACQTVSIDVKSPTNTSESYKFMWDNLKDQIFALDTRIDTLGKQILERFRLGDNHIFHLAGQSPVTAVGMVAFEGNAKNCCRLISSTTLTTEQERVNLDLIEMPSVELFPGQVVVVKGLNLYGKRLVAKEIFTDASLAFNPNLSVSSPHPLKLVVACGPFELAGDFRLFGDLVIKMTEIKPDVLVLIGPFVDIVGLDFSKSPEDLFLQHVVTELKRIQCKVILIPSLRDVHHQFEFPQPPLNISDLKPNLVVASNPATILVNGISIGVCANDVLKHMQLNSNIKTSSDVKEAPQVKFIRHTIQQQSYYPIWPGEATKEDGITTQHVNLTQSDKISMPFTPDVLLYPSAFPIFANNVDSVLCVNPGRIVFQKRPGSFAVLHIQPAEEMNFQPVSNRTRVEILRI